MKVRKPQISVKGTTYARLKAEAKARGVTIVQLVAEVLDGAAR